MYRVKTIFSDVYRHGRRNLIAWFLLLSVMSVVFCGFFYQDYARKQCQKVSEKYQNLCYVSFRDDLQYNPGYPHLSALDARLNGTSGKGGVPDIFFDADAMAEYNHPYPASRELFRALGSSEYCENYEIAYAENAYGFAEDIPPRMQEILNVIYSSHEAEDVPSKILTEHIVAGGSLDAFCRIAREITSGYLYDFILLEGSDNPGPGECVITDFSAEIYGKSIGDGLVLTDITGKVLTELTVTGIYGVYVTDRYEFVDPQIPRSGHKLTGSDITGDYTGAPDLGTPFDRLGEDLGAKSYSQDHYFGEYFRIENAMIGLIHTDFDTAYHLYGTADTDPNFEERHHFNNFFAYYQLKNTSDTAAFESEMKRIFPDFYREEFTVYPFENSYDTFRRIPQNLLQTADSLIMIAGCLTVLLCLVVSLISVRENGRETGILLSLGISDRDIICKTACETALITLTAAAAASLWGRLVHAVLSDGYTYLELYGAEYTVTGTGVLFAAGAVIGSFLTTALFTMLYIRIHTPIKLMRQD